MHRHLGNRCQSGGNRARLEWVQVPVDQVKGEFKDLLLRNDGGDPSFLPY